MSDLDENSFRDWVGTPDSGIAGVTADANAAFSLGVHNFYQRP
jgi:hypothetical protein